MQLRPWLRCLSGIGARAVVLPRRHLAPEAQARRSRAPQRLQPRQARERIEARHLPQLELEDLYLERHAKDFEAIATLRRHQSSLLRIALHRSLTQSLEPARSDSRIPVDAPVAELPPRVARHGVRAGVLGAVLLAEQELAEPSGSRWSGPDREV